MLVEAQGKAEQLRIVRRNEGIQAISFASHDRVDADRALELLRPHKVTLLQAAEFYLANMHVIRESKSVEAVAQELFWAKEKDGRSTRYLVDLKQRLRVFSKAFAGRPIHHIGADEIDNWLRSLESSAATRNNYRRILSVVFSFAVKKHYAMKNPVSDVEVATVKITKPGILTR